MSIQIIIHSPNQFLSQEENIKTIIRNAFQYTSNQMDKICLHEEFEPEEYFEIFPEILYKKLLEHINFTSEKLLSTFLLQIPLAFKEAVKFITKDLEKSNLDNLMEKLENKFVQLSYEKTEKILKPFS